MDYDEEKLRMTNIMKRKKPMTKITMLTIMNTTKWMKTNYMIFYKSQINSMSHIKLKKNKIFFEDTEKNSE